MTWVSRSIASVLACGSLALAEPIVGVDANYTPLMEENGHRWSVDGKPDDGLAILSRSGFNGFRVRLWTKDTGPHGLDFATKLAARAQKAGLKPYVVMFLSDDWSDYVKQPAPEEWRKLSVDDRAKAIEAYAERVAKRFKDDGITVDTFEIGNEIDFGICGVFEEEWPKRMSLDYMRAKIWPDSARLIAAAERGVRKINPDAKFILHLTQWWNPDYATAFFQTVQQHGASVDYAGLSFFPTAPMSEQNALAFFQQQIGKLHEAVKKPIVICEFAYPSAPKFDGQFADWNKPVAGYELSEADQARWLADFLKLARSDARLAGVYYWSPEW